jgi:hypothetical protein
VAAGRSSDAPRSSVMRLLPNFTPHTPSTRRRDVNKCSLPAVLRTPRYVPPDVSIVYRSLASSRSATFWAASAAAYSERRRSCLSRFSGIFAGAPWPHGRQLHFLGRGIEHQFATTDMAVIAGRETRPAILRVFQLRTTGRTFPGHGSTPEYIWFREGTKSGRVADTDPGGACRP